MTATAPVQAGRATWRLDPAHSSVEFSIKHLMMTTVRGRFNEVRGTLVGDEAHPRGCAVDVAITAASVDTGVPERDMHLRGPDFFDAERYPTITFRSTRVDGELAKEGDRFQVTGDLTIRDTTMPITLDCVYDGRGRDPWGKERAGFSARTELDRREWGLKWNQVLETGGVLVANTVRVDVEVQFVKEGD
jgi:polyisoprenoid-binding protein YceI